MFYEYQTIVTVARSWGRVKAALQGPCAARVAGAGGSLYGAWRGQIGLGAFEAIVMTAWPDEQSLSKGRGLVIDSVDAITESSCQNFVATVRPLNSEPPTLPGIYAHRSFEIDEADWPEFLELSEGAWPSFEETNDANIIGFFRSLDVKAPAVRVLLLTRYASLAVWELSRGHRDDTLTTRATFERFVRRQKLTASTVVFTTEPL